MTFSGSLANLQDKIRLLFLSVFEIERVQRTLTHGYIGIIPEIVDRDLHHSVESRLRCCDAQDEPPFDMNKAGFEDGFMPLSA